jgi:S-layer homology domain
MTSNFFEARNGIVRNNSIKRPWRIPWVVIAVPVLHVAVAWAFFSNGHATTAVGPHTYVTSPAAVAVPMDAPPGVMPAEPASVSDTPVAGAIFTATPIATATDTPGAPSPQPTAVPTVCAPNFSDVQPSDWFYGPVQWMACNGFAGGYADHTFRPGNNATRSQMAKIVVLAARWPPHEPQTPTFSDVLPGSAFYSYVETAAAHGYSIRLRRWYVPPRQQRDTGAVVQDNRARPRVDARHARGADLFGRARELGLLRVCGNGRAPGDRLRLRGRYLQAGQPGYSCPVVQDNPRGVYDPLGLPLTLRFQTMDDGRWTMGP